MAKVGGLRQSLQLLFKTARKATRRREHRADSMPLPMAMDAAQATMPFWQPGFLRGTVMLTCLCVVCVCVCVCVCV